MGSSPLSCVRSSWRLLSTPIGTQQHSASKHRQNRAGFPRLLVAAADKSKASWPLVDVSNTIQRTQSSPTLTSRRGIVAIGTLVSTAPFTVLCPARAASPQKLLPLGVYLESIRTAQEELQALQSKIQVAGAASTPLPFPELQSSLQTGQLGRLRDASIGADEYLGEDNLEAWEEAAWEAMPQAEDKWRDGMRDAGEDPGTRITKLRLNMPGLDRTNALTCLVFSCFNDPRQPPSTNHMLTFKMLQEGVSMGARGDKRITPDGLSLIIDDLQGDLHRFLSLAAEREALFRSLSEERKRQ